jgi:hypothetical protein
MTTPKNRSSGTWRDFITHLKEMTRKRLKGRLGGGAGYTARTDDLMVESGCLYHTSWIIDDQPWPINVRGGQKFIYVPYTGQPNDAHVGRIGQVRSLLDKRVEAAVTVALVSGAVRAVKSLSISSRIALN